MANRISGSTVGVIVSFVGYILLVVKYRPMILALPLIGIGLFSLWGGLRFTVYAVPVAAMGGVFFIYVIGSYVRNNIAKYSVITILTALMIYPNIQHIIEYKVPTVFNKTEVKVLEKLKTISNPKDYTLAWWDYGYPIWYYSNTNTLIDGGKHKHDNFIISKILTGSSQLLSANLARLSVETYISSDYKIVADQLFKNRQKDQLDPNIFLDKLKSTEYVLPKKTRDIYFYLPYKMLNIFPTVSLFSNLNLQTGQQNKRPFFFVSRNFKQTAKGINLGSNIDLYNTGRIQIGNNNLNVNKIVTTFYDKKNKLHTEIQTIDKNSPVNVIFMKNYNTFLVIDNQVFNSVYIQLFVLENYDKSLFEPVILNPQVKIYKLKV
jgi:dolichyl-diphosphooligosaccharide--protein glycosyltransferase/undecaprenyl-diphosphooligosaccharide--protein glycosyltransferase